MADSLRIVGGKLLLASGGKLALSDTCCCQVPPCSGPCENSEDCAPGCFCVDGVCVESGACCGWICDYVADIIWPDIENPEDIPEYEPPEGWFAGGPGFLTKTINGAENCDDPDVVETIKAELQAELDAVVAGLGGFSVVSLSAETSGLGCLPIEVTEQTCSDTYAGTWYATLEECLENCNPLPSADCLCCHEILSTGFPNNPTCPDGWDLVFGNARCQKCDPIGCAQCEQDCPNIFDAELEIVTQFCQQNPLP